MTKILIVLSLFFVLFSFSPSIYEIYQAKNIPKGRVFTLEHNYMFDYNFYLSRIREGIEGKYLVVEKYYNQPHQGSLFQIVYLILGRLGGLGRLEPPAVYHGARLIFGLVLLVLSGKFVSIFFTKNWQLVSYLFIVTSGSWPVLVFAGGLPRFATHMGWWSAIDSLQRITFLPHVLLGQIFILLFIAFFGALSHKSPKSLRLLKLIMWGILGFIAGIIFPPTLVVVYTYFIVLSMIEVVTKLLKPACAGRSPRLLKEWSQEIALPRGFFILFSLPSLLYLQMMFKLMPWSALALFDIQHRTGLPYNEYFLALGPVLPLGVIGGLLVLGRLGGLGRSWRLEMEEKLIPVVAWVISIFLLFKTFENIPTQSPLRFTEALLHVPLGILTAYFFYLFWQKCQKFSHSLKILVRGLTVAIVIIIILMGLGVMLSMVGWLDDQVRAKGQGTWEVPIGAQLVYPLKDFMDGIYYIRDHINRDSVILTYVTAGNYIPAYAGNYVYIGHANTPDEDGKEKIAARFFKGEMSEAETKEFLQKERISYIYFGPQEKELGKITNLIEKYSFLIPVYQNQRVTIYKVADPPPR